ncbi:MAG: AraC family transcriptional regulator [Myxococcota bacterium]
MSSERGSEHRTAHGWSGRVFVGVGRALYLGPSADTTLHDHHAIQIAVGIDRKFQLRGGSGRPWESHDGIIIPSNQLHQFDGSGADLLSVYIEPESDDGRRIEPAEPTGHYHEVPQAALRELRAAVRDARRQPFGARLASQLYGETLLELGFRVCPGPDLDRRLQRAIRALRESPAGHRSVSDLSRSVGLSPRRFRDLFAEQIGMSCRRYVLWVRLYAAIRETAGGASLTQAALVAGFSDAAHLTRTFRRMFGIAPSAVSRSVSFFEETSSGRKPPGSAG